jgi:cbb3-type cytochrome oxidase maturation protein
MSHKEYRSVYFPYFIAYIGIGLAIAGTAFFWALRNGQFLDQERARFLPLEKEGGAGHARTSRRRRWEIYLLFFLACAGLLSSGAVLLVSLMAAGK